MQVTQATQRVGHLKQGPVDIVTQASKEFVRRGIQVNDLTPLAQVLAICGSQDNTATGRQNTFRILGELVDDRLFKITKPVFPFPLEILTDRAADLLLYDVVGVKERKLKSPGQLTPDGGFT